MRNAILITLLCWLASLPLVANAYDLSCKSEWSEKNEIVEIPDAKTFEEACKNVKDDPSYGQYKDCKDGEGNKKGKCPKE